MATFTRLFQGCFVALSAILGRTPTMDEYKIAVQSIPLTQFAPPVNKIVATS